MFRPPAKPVSHADVADVLVPQGFDKSTLYRCLVELADAGLLARLDAGDHAWRFELRATSSTPAANTRTLSASIAAQVTCLPDVEVKISPPKATKAPLGDVTEVFLKGHCKECLG